MKKRLYVDSSSLIRVADQAFNWRELSRIIDDYKAANSTLVSSRLLELECQRFAIRTGLTALPNNEITNLIKDFTLIPIDDDIWRVAMGITQNIKASDALHLATCSLIPDVALLTSDKNMASVALEMGISFANSSD